MVLSSIIPPCMAVRQCTRVLRITHLFVDVVCVSAWKVGAGVEEVVTVCWHMVGMTMYVLYCTACLYTISAVFQLYNCTNCYIS